MAQPDVSTIARRVAVHIEDRIRHDALETGVLIARNGRILAQHQGQPAQVGCTTAEYAMAKDATFTHNHPGGTGPSLDDALVAAQWGMREVRIVTDRFRYGIRKLNSGIMIPLQAAFALEERGAIADTLDDIRMGRFSPVDFEPEARHRTWLRVVNRLPIIDYWRCP